MDDPMVHCPFELSHMCKQSRFQKHLVKCRKNHPESKLEPCPYNATEYIDPAKLVDHLKVCTKAKLLEGQKYSAERMKESYLDAPFHVTSRQVSDVIPEDFEEQGFSMNQTDELILERSVSQMSLNSMSNDNPSKASRLDSVISSLKLGTPLLRDGSRSSSLRSVGRGYAMAGLISVLQQIEERDYSKYELKQGPDTEKQRLKEISKGRPPELESSGKNVSADSCPQKQSKFCDASEKEHGGSFSSAQPKASEINFAESSSDESVDDDSSGHSSDSTVKNVLQSPVCTPSLKPYPHSKEDFDFRDSSGSLPISVTSTSRNESAASFRSDSTCSRENSESVSNSSSRVSFLSLIKQNMLENDSIVSKIPKVDTRYDYVLTKSRPGYRGRNHAPQKHHSNSSQPVGCGRGSNFSLSFQSNSSFGRGQQSAEKSPACQSNRNSFSPAPDSVGRESYPSQQHSIGRGSLLQQVKSVGRGILLSQSSSVGPGNFCSGGNAESQVKFFGRGSQNVQSSFVGRGSEEGQFSSLGRGVGDGQVNFNGRGRGDGQARPAIGRGSIENQRSGFGRGRHLVKPDESHSRIGQGESSSITANSFNSINFEGKSSTEIYRDSFQEVYDNYKNLQMPTSFSPVESLGPKQMRTVNCFFISAQPAHESVPILSHVPSSRSEELNVITEVAVVSDLKSKNKNERKKKKKKTKKNSKQTIDLSNAVDSAFKSNLNLENSPQEPNDVTPIKILNKSMDPWKYFGSDVKDNNDQKQVTNKCSSETKENISQNSKKSNPKKVTTCKKIKAYKSQHKYHKMQAKNPNKPLKTSVDNAPNHRQGIKEVTFESKENVSHNTSKKGKKVTFGEFINASKSQPKNYADEFEIYDQFYSNMCLGPSTGQSIMSHSSYRGESTPSLKSACQKIKVSTNQGYEKNKESSSSVAYASVNCISIPPENAHGSPCNPDSSLSFPTLHSPQKSRFPGRYDKLCGTGYKYMLRSSNRKPKVFQQKSKIMNHERKVSVQDRNIHDLNQENKKSSCSLDVAFFNHAVNSNQTKTLQNLKKQNVKSRSQSKSNFNAVCTGVGNEMTLWNKNSFRQVSHSSPGDISMNQQSFSDHSNSKKTLWNKNSYKQISHSSPGDISMNQQSFADHSNSKSTQWNKNSYHQKSHSSSGKIFNNHCSPKNNIDSPMTLWSKNSYHQISHPTPGKIFNAHQSYDDNSDSNIMLWNKNSRHQINHSSSEKFFNNRQSAEDNSFYAFNKASFHNKNSLRGARSDKNFRNKTFSRGKKHQAGLTPHQKLGFGSNDPTAGSLMLNRFSRPNIFPFSDY